MHIMLKQHKTKKKNTLLTLAAEQSISAVCGGVQPLCVSDTHH